MENISFDENGPEEQARHQRRKKQLIWAGVGLTAVILAIIIWQYWQYINSDYYRDYGSDKTTEKTWIEIVKQAKNPLKSSLLSQIFNFFNDGSLTSRPALTIVSESSLLQSRPKPQKTISPILTTPSQPTPSYRVGDLVINEIMYNPGGADDKHEWFEIYNNSGHAITLTGGNNGWRFHDGSNHLLNEPPTNSSRGSLTLSAGEYAILSDNAITFLSDYSGYNGTIIDTVMSLKNSTSTLKIIAPDGIIIDKITYLNSWGANGNGKTLERKTAAGGSNDASNWAESSFNGGTPGTINNYNKN
ncbi:hypothetical protein A2608_02720 [Candidatus Azambacteria bacterium RIFOXYD1_FULL_44_10]|uniref:LTD domain-containing protein n=1 Tax=Candidatus Azambacteria bacterium RIFCSPLOWO2_02_FULL_44_14 TaxID=1797306 RepID=A0A1F5CCF0_9BACT|nr:MAG: hypothetical protein A3C78_00860 [Candidatus Azambacteria bacterium RIFCSPHIGHO2_02_FULL_45_18]OGD40508.1 MAG: hypothetical protein A3I30_00890 [Candidatus Azambacteria bacterium RIFCSPLOWO2_02_FULL_44_14]OGD52247.1 MAG: hypothetical protein A2608_02720 [Candidatus Azambacteria bacterium RIFOXYD1_FULL_44_10]